MGVHELVLRVKIFLDPYFGLRLRQQGSERHYDRLLGMDEKDPDQSFKFKFVDKW
jgi:hypothetical protein